MTETHPEHALIALLLPGIVFCILMFMDRKKHTPKIVAFGWEMPISLIYLTVFVTGPLLLVAMLVQSIRNK